MEFFLKYFISEDLNEYSFSLILFNVLAYIFVLINLFLVFFMFDMKYLKTLNELKFFGNLPLITTFLVLLLLSFAGVPPLLGFISKFLVFIYIISKSNFLFLFLFVFSNMFVIYFYIQNLRFLVSKGISNKFFLKNYNVYLNNDIIYIFNVFNYFNILAIFYFEEFLIFLNFISSNFYF